MGRGGWSAGALSIVCSLAFAASAPAAVSVGQTFVPSLQGDTGGGGGVPPSTVLQVSSPADQYAAPTAGVLTSWSFQSGATPPAFLKLKVARAASPVVSGSGGFADSQVFTIVGDSATEAPGPGLNTFPTRISVQQGDVIGFFAPPEGEIASVVSDPAYRIGVQGSGGDPPPGASQTFFLAPSGSPSIQLDVSAQLEPDCDNDGFGDETQDADLKTCPGPTVDFSKQPKNKVKAKKQKVKVTYAFTSSEPGATFTCELDGKQKACTSPFKAKVKKGKHKFSVVATGAGGKLGAPAKDSFKVKPEK